jgi:restriction system protein
MNKIVFGNLKSRAASASLGVKLMYATLKILKEKGGELGSDVLVSELEQVVDLNDWAKHRHEKSGYIRWVSILHFHSICLLKAGYIIKKKGVWLLTPEGKKATQYTPDVLFEKSEELYKAWSSSNPRKVLENNTSEDKFEEDIVQSQTVMIDEVEGRAKQSLKEYLDGKNGHEFQDVVAALLRGMGYFTPFIAPPGKDGGIDILAYQDPLGTKTPRIKVQVKHRNGSVGSREVQQLLGTLHKDGDVGLFVSTGGFSPDAKSIVRNANTHVELIDYNRFLELWQNFYPKMSDTDKAFLPLYPVYFLAPEEV